MATDNGGRDSSLKIVMIVLGVVGVSFLMCCGLVVVCITAIQLVGTNASGTFSTAGSAIGSGAVIAQDPGTAAREFLDALGRDQFFTAQLTGTVGFRSRHSVEDLRGLVQKHPALKRPTSTVLTPREESPTRVTFQGNLKGPNGSAAATVEVRKEADGWRVERFSVP